MQIKKVKAEKNKGLKFITKKVFGQKTNFTFH